MRRTSKDVKHLYKCYCCAWQCRDIERTRRIANHGWVRDVWIREYDNVVRMSPTDTGRMLAVSYRDYKADNSEDFSVTKFLQFADFN